MSGRDKTGGARAAWIDRAVVLGCVLYGAALVSSTPRAVGGADSSGYLSLAKLLSRGEAVAAVPGLGPLGLDDRWRGEFTPLGFLSSGPPGTMQPVYPPGYPLLIAAAATVAGWDVGPFLLPGLFAALGVGLLYVTGKRLGLGPGYAAGCAAALAAWPPYVFTGVQLMSDTVTTAWSIGAVLLVIVARQRERDSAALLCGAVFAFSVVIRPANVLLAPALALMLLPSMRRVLLAVAGGIAVGAPWLLYNAAVYGHPLSTGYAAALASGDLAVGNFPARVAHYGYWLAVTLPLPLIAWLLLPSARRIEARTRAVLVAWGATYLAFYCFYRYFDTWWYLRFLAPAVPAMLLAGGLALQDWQSRRPDRWRNRVAAAGLILTIGIGLGQGWRLDVIDSVQPQMNFVRGTDWLRELEPPVIVASWQFSGAVYAYTDAVPVRYDALVPATFEQLRRQSELAGYRWYALLEAWEPPLLSDRLPAEWRQVRGYPGISLWALAPRTAAQYAGLDSEGLAEILEGVARIDDGERRGRLEQRVRRAYQRLRAQDYATAEPLLIRAEAALASLAAEQEALAPAARRLRDWLALLPPAQPEGR